MRRVRTLWTEHNLLLSLSETDTEPVDKNSKFIPANLLKLFANKELLIFIVLGA